METTLLPGETANPRFAERYALKILVADDNYTNRRLLLLMLRSLGYEAEARENGRECFDAAIHGDFDLLLSNIDMPEMSGIDCTVALREAGLDLPIIAVTATAPETSRLECYHAGMNGFMRKPISLTDLTVILREAALRKWLHDANLAVARGA